MSLVALGRSRRGETVARGAGERRSVAVLGRRDVVPVEHKRVLTWLSALKLHRTPPLDGSLVWCTSSGGSMGIICLVSVESPSERVYPLLIGLIFGPTDLNSSGA